MKKQDTNEINSGNKTEITIEKNKNGNIIIETEQDEAGDEEAPVEQPKKKKFLFW